MNVRDQVERHARRRADARDAARRRDYRRDPDTDTNRHVRARTPRRTR